jgi:molybdenum cofactor cytidylyltransferase
MGRPKLALPLRDRTVLELVVTALREAGIEHVVVVIGPHVAELESMAEKSGAEICRLADETADMRATVEYGLDWCEKRFHPIADDYWLLVPADHPAVEADVVRQLVRAQKFDSGHSIFVPSYQGRRGHPALLAWKHVAGIKALPKELGINRYLRQFVNETLEVAVTSPAVLWDMDKPEDYERLRGIWGDGV